MKHQRLAWVAVICLLGVFAACTYPSGTATPTVADEPRGAFEKSENEYFYFLAAQKERRDGKTDKAILLLRKAIEIDPDSSYLQRELATIFLQNKEEDKALEVLDELLARHPEDAKGLILYGGIQQLRKQNDAAIVAYEKVIAIDPSQEKIYSLLGSLYLEGNQLEPAERVLGKLVEKFPNAYAGHFLLGRVYLARASRFWRKKRSAGARKWTPRA